MTLYPEICWWRMMTRSKNQVRILADQEYEIQDTGYTGIRKGIRSCSKTRAKQGVVPTLISFNQDLNLQLCSSNELQSKGGKKVGQKHSLCQAEKHHIRFHFTVWIKTVLNGSSLYFGLNVKMLISSHIISIKCTMCVDF